MSRTDSGRIEEITAAKVNDPKILTQLISECVAMGCHVLTPMQKIDKIAEAFTISLGVVRIDPDDSDLVYHDNRWKKDEVAITHVGLLLIWNAAGGRFNHSEASNPTGERHLVRSEVGGGVRDPAGGFQSAIESRVEDYRDGADQVQGWTEKQLKEARSRQFERAESFAQNRVIRKILGVRQKYTKQELQAPFIVVRTTFRIDPSNPIHNTIMVADATEGAAALYRSEGFARMLERAAEVYGGQSPVAEIATGRPARQIEQGRPDAEKLQEATDQGEAPEPNPAEEQLLDFQQLDKDGMVKCCQDMMGDRSYAADNLSKPLSKFNKAELEALFGHLLTLPRGGKLELPFKT